MGIEDHRECCFYPVAFLLAIDPAPQVDTGLNRDARDSIDPVLDHQSLFWNCMWKL